MFANASNATWPAYSSPKCYSQHAERNRIAHSDLNHLIVARDWYALAKKIAKDREEIRSLFPLSRLNKIEDFSEVVDRAERRFFCLLDYDNFHYELSDYAKGIRAEESRKRRERQEGQNAEEDKAENKKEPIREKVNRELRDS